ncbi:MAG TPA: HepT-like ribonuclease domain-containing protein [Armatimonadota bacterium]|jgi:uncharacterized protein with HEPN domain
MRRERGFRNVIVHAYFAADETIIWNAATAELPVLRAAVAGMLEKGLPAEP